MPLGGILNEIQVSFPKVRPTGGAAVGSIKAIVKSDRMPTGAEKVHKNPGWKRFGKVVWL